MLLDRIESIATTDSVTVRLQAILKIGHSSAALLKPRFGHVDRTVSLESTTYSLISVNMTQPKFLRLPSLTAFTGAVYAHSTLGS